MKEFVKQSKNGEQWVDVFRKGKLNLEFNLSEIGSLHVIINRSNDGQEVNAIGHNGFFLLRNSQNFESIINMIRGNTMDFMRRGWSNENESTLANAESSIVDIIRKKVQFDNWGMNIVLIYMSLQLAKVCQNHQTKINS